ncbi:hypothetical protein [Sphingobium sp. EM0848]|uniref:hypothetical protein n=1 Tax=Sphingobium sp. EM0848 TaxID=2743473 RepID=UPI00159C4DE2|nr:hypothetical protein [Sphingobium sp. EM0848]
MVRKKTGNCTLMIGMTGSAVIVPATAQGSNVKKTMIAASLGVPKFLKHIPQTMAAADRHAMVARTQSPLVRQRKVPKPTEAAHAQESNAASSRGGVCSIRMARRP